MFPYKKPSEAKLSFIVHAECIEVVHTNNPGKRLLCFYWAANQHQVTEQMIIPLTGWDTKPLNDGSDCSKLTPSSYTWQSEQTTHWHLKNKATKKSGQPLKEKLIGFKICCKQNLLFVLSTISRHFHGKHLPESDNF